MDGPPALAIVVGGVRGLDAPPDTLFANILTRMTNHPILTIVAAGLGGWFINLAFLRAALSARDTAVLLRAKTRHGGGDGLSDLARRFQSVELCDRAIGSCLGRRRHGLGTALALYWAYSHLGRVLTGRDGVHANQRIRVRGRVQLT